jgi:hypothetical protein
MTMHGKRRKEGKWLKRLIITEAAYAIGGEDPQLI